MTTAQWALTLYAAGAIFAIWGPGIATTRIIRKYRRTANLRGTYDEMDALVKPEIIRPAALRDAVWSSLEFVFTGAGVLLASIASIILVIPLA